MRKCVNIKRKSIVFRQCFSRMQLLAVMLEIISTDLFNISVSIRKLPKFQDYLLSKDLKFCLGVKFEYGTNIP